MGQDEKDKIIEGHEADGIQELDNGLPKWWLYGFYLTIVLGAIYLFYYHAWDGPDWNFLWYRQRGQVNEYNAEMGGAPKAVGVKDFSAFKQRTDAASLAIGENIFQKTNLCYTCHRPDLGGLIGPNLTDKYWLHGGNFQDILADIWHGYPEKGMLKFGNGNTLTDDQLVDVASYVLSKQGTNPPNPKPVDSARDVLFTGR